MHVKKFGARHIGHIIGWLNMRGLSPAAAHDLPGVGFIVFDQEDAVCAAFLRSVEGRYALIDSGISNPAISAPRRNEGMQLVTEACIKEAGHRNVKALLVLTQDPNTLSRVKALGFAPTKDIFLKKSI